MDVSANKVYTEQGSVIYCRRVIIAVDGKLEKLLPELASEVRTTRLQMIATAPTGEAKVEIPLYTRNGFDYWQSLPDGSIAIGGFRDIDEEAEWGYKLWPEGPI